MKWILVTLTGFFGSAVCLAGPVNINTADAETLARELNGVGYSRAEAIVAWRDMHGPFQTVQELQKVKGIGPKVLHKNRGDILLADPQVKSD